MKISKVFSNFNRGRAVFFSLALVLLLSSVLIPVAYAQDTADVSAILYISTDDTLGAALIAVRDDDGSISLIALPTNTRGIVNIKKSGEQPRAVYSTLASAYNSGGNTQAEKIGNVCDSLSRILGGITIDEIYALDSNSFANCIEKIGGILCDAGDLPTGLDFSFGGYSSIQSGDTSPTAIWLKKTQMIKGAKPSSLSQWQSLNAAGPRKLALDISRTVMLSGENAALSMETCDGNANLACKLISALLSKSFADPSLELEFAYKSENADLFDASAGTSVKNIIDNASVISGHTRTFDDDSFFIPDTTALTEWVMEKIYLTSKE